MSEIPLTEPKILLVDDEADILEMLSYNLEKARFSVTTALNGEEALEKFQKSAFDVVLLDIMMDGLDGVETCRRLRDMPNGMQPFVIFLTARSEEYSQIAGFEAGADDYISKPVKPKVLIKKIQALIARKSREQGIEPDSQELVIDDLRILKDEYLVFHQDKSVTLRKKEFELLLFLAKQPGKVFSREVLLENVWGTNVHVVDRTIDVHVRKLREKIGKEYIQTVQGVGYKFRGRK